MAFFLGLVLGDLLGRIGFFRAAGALMLLAGLSFVTYRMLMANGGAWCAGPAAIAVLTLVFLWALWSPASSRTRLYIVEGVYLAARLLIWICAFMAALILLQVGFRIDEWVARGAWWWGMMGAGRWVIQALISAWTMRSDRLLGEHSVI